MEQISKPLFTSPAQGREEIRKTSIQDLPDELLLQIFGQLHEGPISACRAVSRRFNAVAKDPSLKLQEWKRLYTSGWTWTREKGGSLKIVPRKGCASLQDLFAERQFLKSLNVPISLHFPYDPGEELHFLAKLIEKDSPITSLKLGGAMDLISEWDQIFDWDYIWLPTTLFHNGPEGNVFLTALASNTSLRLLDLSGCILSDRVDHLVNFLRTNQVIEKLLLRETDLSPPQVEVLAAGLSRHPSLRDLDLSDNPITDESARILTQALLPNQAFTRLEVRGNRLSRDGVETLSDLMYLGSPVERVDARGNELSPSEVIVCLAKGALEAMGGMSSPNVFSLDTFLKPFDWGL